MMMLMMTTTKNIDDDKDDDDIGGEGEPFKDEALSGTHLSYLAC